MKRIFSGKQSGPEQEKKDKGEAGMNYTVFSAHTIGKSHIRAGMGCEDYSGHYKDPEGRYMIAVICDGHSDPKCFRSARGARMGCEAALEVLKNLFENYQEDGEPEALSRFLDRKSEVSARIRAGILQEWNQKVAEDLKEEPITQAEYDALDTPQYRPAMKYYQEGKGLNNIYGATLIAAAACADFHLVLQIGDGIAVRLEGEGVYSAPLPEDDKEEMEGPASLCDTDLLSREKAFRLEIFPGIPQAMFVTSDGIGDMPLSVPLRENLCLFQRELLERRGEQTEGILELNEEQGKWLEDFISYYSRQGLEDDCCLGGFFDSAAAVEEVALSSEELDKLRRDLEQDRKEKEERYLDTKDKLQTALKENQDKIQKLCQQIDSLRQKTEKLEKQLEQERKESEHIRNVIERREKDYTKTKSDYDRQKNYIAEKEEAGSRKASGAAKSQEEDWPRLRLEELEGLENPETESLPEKKESEEGGEG